MKGSVDPANARSFIAVEFGTISTASLGATGTLLAATVLVQEAARGASGSDEFSVDRGRLDDARVIVGVRCAI